MTEAPGEIGKHNYLGVLQGLCVSVIFFINASKLEEPSGSYRGFSKKKECLQKNILSKLL